MKKTFKNLEMVAMVQELQTLLSHRDIVGYAAARNTRALSQSLTEYNALKAGLIEKYGEAEIDEHSGRETGRVVLKMESPKFQAFLGELEPFNAMEHEVELMMLKYGDVIGILSGEEILSIDWMLKD